MDVRLGFSHNFLSLHPNNNFSILYTEVIARGLWDQGSKEQKRYRFCSREKPRQTMNVQQRKCLGNVADSLYQLHCLIRFEYFLWRLWLLDTVYLPVFINAPRASGKAWFTAQLSLNLLPQPLQFFSHSFSLSLSLSLSLFLSLSLSFRVRVCVCLSVCEHREEVTPGSGAFVTKFHEMHAWKIHRTLVHCRDGIHRTFVETPRVFAHFFQTDRQIKSDKNQWILEIL